MARQNISRVMAEKVADGFFTETEAVRVARMILHGNPNRMFGWRRA